MGAFFEGENEPAGLVTSDSPGVQVAAWLDAPVISANQLQEAHVRFLLEPDAHLYTEPVPDGFNAISITLTGDDTLKVCLLYTSPSPRDQRGARMPSSA